MECRQVKDRTHFAALMAVAYHVRGDGGLCTAAKPTLAAEARLSKRALDGALLALADADGPSGYGVAVVECLSPGGGRSGTPTYRLNLAWLAGPNGSDDAARDPSETVQPLHPNTSPEPSVKGAGAASNGAPAAPFETERVQPLRLKGAAAAHEPVLEPVGEEEDERARGLIWTGEAEPFDPADYGETAAAHRSAVDAALALSGRERVAWACQVLHAGNTPPADRLRDLAALAARAGPEALVVALAITDHAGVETKAYRSRLRYLTRVLDSTAHDAHRLQHAPTEPTTAARHPPGRRGAGRARPVARRGAHGPGFGE